MKMSRFEKFFVNREGKGRKNWEKVADRLQELNLNEIQDALEIGCGIGTVSANLANAYGMQVVGTDFDPAQIELALELHPALPNLSFRIEDAAGISFDDDSFDLVIAHNCFHHVPDWRAAMREIGRVLRPGGHLMWLDFVFARPIRLMLTSLRKNESFFSLDEVRTAFRSHSLSELQHQRMTMLLFAQHHFLLRRPK